MDFLEQLKKMEEAKVEMEKEMEREGILIERKRRATLNPGQILQFKSKNKLEQM